MHVNIRAVKSCRILHITEASMKTVLQDEEELEKNMFLCQSRLFSQDKLFPLDYVQKIPRMLRDPRFTEGELTGFLRRRNILKNVVFRRILAIRKLLAKPSLSTILEDYKDKDGHFDKEAARAKIHCLYGDPGQVPSGHQHDHDDKFEALMEQLTAIEGQVDKNSGRIETMLQKVKKTLKLQYKRKKYIDSVKKYIETKDALYVNPPPQAQENE